MKTTQNTQAAPALFNLDQLNQIGNDDETFTKQMLEKFITQVYECSESLHSAILTSDWLKLKNTAHKNIPSYSIMGLDELVNLLKYTEIQSAKNKEYNHMLEIVEIICEKNNTVIDAIRKHLRLMENGKKYPDDN
ncbi:MAG TPA: hypothetical protein VN026_13535 [Bacteroidia bacterium]|jgi:HPt (histidine-containing phosphotransfer) domain-containing protein|nr:hypothetical protein [Bacteroidia bacterium]